MYIVIVCIVFLALRDFGGRRFISTVLLLLLLLLRVRFVMTPVQGIKLCAIAAYRLFHSHAQVLTFTDSTK